MKVYQVMLIFFILYVSPCNSTLANLQDEFDGLVNFLETNSESKVKQSYDLYLNRIMKMRRKKEIIIRKVYEISPIVGELLALSNVEKIDLIINRFFIMRERDLLKKHIIMWDADSNYLDHSSKVLLNILLCNNKFNRLRCILNLLMEGLCSGDDRSIRIFKEIVVTVIIDTLLKTNFAFFNDLKAKFNLVRIFNKPLRFKPIIKIKFIEKMKISDKLKEIMTFMIMRLKTNEDIEVELDTRLHQNPTPFANNTRLYNFNPSGENLMTKLSPEEKQEVIQREIDQSIQNNLSANSNPPSPAHRQTLSRSEAKDLLEHLKSYSSFTPMRFKEKILLENENNEKTFTYSEIISLDPNSLDIPKSQKLKLSDIKEQLKNDYTDFLLNTTSSSMPQLEEVQPNYQVGLNERSIFTKYRKHIINLIMLNQLLDEFPPTTIKGSVNLISPNRKVLHSKTTIMKEIAPGVKVSMQFKQTDDMRQSNKEANGLLGVDLNQPNRFSKGKFRFKSLSGISNSLSSMNSMTKDEEFAEKSFIELTGFSKPNNNNYNKPDEPEDQQSNNNFNDDSKTSQNLHPSNNYNADDESINNQIINHSQNSEEIKEIINKSKSKNSNIKILYPKEIHSQYYIKKKGTKTIEINKNNPTKKLILEKLLPESQYNDLMQQQEKSYINDPLGLYTVLKNIQGRKCSCGFLCIEIGTIYGDFDSLKPKNITVPFNEDKNIHMIIKPIIVVNNTMTNPLPPKNDSAKIIDLFDQDDCDELKMNGNQMRFKQINKGIVVKRQNKQRKFYRKVSVADNIYSQDTFRQGLNLIIAQRDRKYTKLFEKTFDTNNSIKESDEMAEILKQTPCSKIIIITGIGKWMGAMTPALIREIKQVGGPDLNNLYSSDQDDNSYTDHAFILIGRRGLCRYNGIFRVKNYDLSKKMARLFPDLSSDPNDCYFEDISLENEKNRNSEKEFNHIIDLRLTLNINNDNRFAWDAPTVSTVAPFRGSIHGGQEIKIGGFNLGVATTDIREILVHGIICGDFILLSPNLVSCVTRASTILGPGPGNVIIKMRNGYESPKRTCNVYEYVGDSAESLSDLKQTITTVQKMQNLPIYMNSNYHDQDISIFDHLMFNSAHYKKKLRPDHSNLVNVKLDHMVNNNYHNMINIVNAPTGVLSPPSEGFRKKRFRNLMNNLEVCDKK